MKSSQVPAAPASDMSSSYRRRDSLFEQVSDINTLQKLLLCAK